MMRNPLRTAWLVGPAFVIACFCPAARGGDWPQWRGPNRDAKATGFTAPATWPKELTKKWQVKVGEGVATPALVGDKLYVFSREGGKEVVRALDAGTGKELWKDEYETGGVQGPASGFSGPRSSPTVADGKVITLGVRGVLSCYDTGGKLIWRKDAVERSWPPFFVASSPIVVDGLCIAQLGGQGSGVVVAYELATGNEKWKWPGDTPAYASPTLLTLGDTKVILAQTDRQIVGINVADGKQVWKTALAPPAGGPPKGKSGGKGGGMGGRGYNAATPMVDGQTLIYSGAGRGTKVVKLEKKGDEVTATDVWTNPEIGVQFNTPVVKDGLVFGVTERNVLFCINKEGKTAWTNEIKSERGYGSVVDVGPVLLALTPRSPLIVFEPTDKGFKEIASYKVTDTGSHAYPVVDGNRIYIKDQDSVILWTIE